MVKIRLLLKPLLSLKVSVPTSSHSRLKELVPPLIWYLQVLVEDSDKWSRADFKWK
jgi:hypothetical protein